MIHCAECGAYQQRMTRCCRYCGYDPKMEWWEYVLLLIVFGGLVMGWYYEVL